MLLEHWNKGKIQRSPQSIPTLPDTFEKECARSRIRGMTEHDREEKIKRGWSGSMRKKPPGSSGSRPPPQDLPKPPHFERTTLK